MVKTSIPLGAQSQSEHNAQARSETILPSYPPELRRSLDEAATSANPLEAFRKIASRNTACLEAWAQLSALSNDPVEAYAFARTGYHRGLDALRAQGWRGSGVVAWSHVENRGFLASLASLARLSKTLGDEKEAQRCEQFLGDCDSTLSVEICI